MTRRPNGGMPDSGGTRRLRRSSGGLFLPLVRRSGAMRPASDSLLRCHAAVLAGRTDRRLRLRCARLRSSVAIPAAAALYEAAAISTT